MRTHAPATTTDLYELTMAAGYWADTRQERATFELFTRRLPRERNYLLAAGLEAVASYLEHFAFTTDELAYLRSVPALSSLPPAFFDALAGLRFTGDMWAVPEGTPIFPNEPLLTISAPLIEAQIFETALLALVNYPTSVAAKASRIVEAAAGRGVIEFGARRAHGTEAALIAARAAFIGGCIGTSNVEAGLRFGLPLFGTVAHAWIMSFDDEIDAFRAYQRSFPSNAVFLIDTYDTVQAARRITEAFQPDEVAGVRLDSGDIPGLARQVRSILDGAGFTSTKIFASGDLNERIIADFVAMGAPIDAYGVGTELTTVKDAPALGGVYKLVELEQDGRRELKMKCSEGKATYPGAKQVWRHSDDSGMASSDTIAFADEPSPAPDARPLLSKVFEGGKRIAHQPALRDIQAYAALGVAALPPRLRQLDVSDEPYPVRFSARILAAREELRARIQGA